MASEFRLLPARIEEAQFKLVPEGWLFTTSNPWVFGPRRTYLVSETQKPAIAKRVRRGRYIRMILLVPMVLLLAAAFINVPSLLDPRSIASWLVFGAFIVAFMTAITVSDYLIVRPLLRDLSRSSQKIGLADMMRRQSETMSVAALVIFTLIFAIAGVTNTYKALAPVHGILFETIGAISFTVCAIAYAGMLIAKLRSHQG
jgi:hypothetical protein